MELTLSQQRRRTAVSTLGDPAILGPAVLDAFRKLDPRLMVRNPVMFTVEVVASLTTVLFIRDLVIGSGGLGFAFQINLWLWFTLLFANFAEAVAEGRGKAQADALRRTRSETIGKVLASQEAKIYSMKPAQLLSRGDLVLVEAETVAEAVAQRPGRRTVVKRGRVVARDGETLP